jgi:hypothetical protein
MRSAVLLALLALLCAALAAAPAHAFGRAKPKDAAKSDAVEGVPAAKKGKAKSKKSKEPAAGKSVFVWVCCVLYVACCVS